MPEELKAGMEEGTVCQECLEREMGNWLELDASPELVKLMGHAFGSLSDHGRCGICGRGISLPYQFQPKSQFDCLSEELEYGDFREELLEGQPQLFMN